MDARTSDTLDPAVAIAARQWRPERCDRVALVLQGGGALGIHWGTFQLTFEPIDEPRQRLEALKREKGIAAERFVAVEAGQGFMVP